MSICITEQLQSTIQFLNFYRDATTDRIHIIVTDNEYNYIQKSLERININKQKTRERERIKYIKKSSATNAGRKKGQTGLLIALPVLN